MLSVLLSRAMLILREVRFLHGGVFLLIFIGRPSSNSKVGTNWPTGNPKEPESNVQHFFRRNHDKIINISQNITVLFFQYTNDGVWHHLMIINLHSHEPRQVQPLGAPILCQISKYCLGPLYF